MVRIKICGITRPEDAALAAEAGADAVGLVFAKSPRQVSTRQARDIVAALPPFVSAVGVFVNARPTTILRIVETVGLSEVQLHGDEPPAFLAHLEGLRAIKALRVRTREFLTQVHDFAGAGVGGILLDAYTPRARGGAGRPFDWDLVVQAREAGALDACPPIVLAGGLSPQNVRAAIRAVRPWGVDVSSGVEHAPGIKNEELMERFVAAARDRS